MKITNRHGLHARPAARLVQEARLYDARIELRNLDTGAGPAPATSLSRVATLGALCGHRVEVTATGSQAREAVDHVVALAARRFDEPDHTDVPAPPAVDAARNGKPLPASPGIAIGQALSVLVGDVDVPDEPSAGATPTPSGAGSAARSRRCAARSSGSGRSRPGRSATRTPGSSTRT